MTQNIMQRALNSTHHFDHQKWLMDASQADEAQKM